MHKCAIILMMFNGLVLGLLVLYNSFLWLTPGLEGCVDYWQHLSSLYCSYAPYPAIVDVCELSKSNKLMPPSYSSHTETSNKKKKHDVWLNKYDMCCQYLNLILSSFLSFSNRLLVVTFWMLFRVRYLMIWRRDSKLLVNSALHVKSQDSSAYA